MLNSLNFLPRREMNDMARDAYRTFLTRATVKSMRNRHGVLFTAEIDCDLDTVFIRFNAPNGEAKVSVHPIRKGWGY